DYTDQRAQQIEICRPGCCVLVQASACGHHRVFLSSHSVTLHQNRRSGALGLYHVIKQVFSLGICHLGVRLLRRNPVVSGDCLQNRGFLLVVNDRKEQRIAFGHLFLHKSALTTEKQSPVSVEPFGITTLPCVWPCSRIAS